MIEDICWVDCHPSSVANALDGEACRLDPQSIVLPLTGCRYGMIMTNSTSFVFSSYRHESALPSMSSSTLSISGYCGVKVNEDRAAPLAPTWILILGVKLSLRAFCRDGLSHCSLYCVFLDLVDALGDRHIFLTVPVVMRFNNQYSLTEEDYLLVHSPGLLALLPSISEHVYKLPRQHRNHRQQLQWPQE